MESHIQDHYCNFEPFYFLINCALLRKDYMSTKGVILKRFCCQYPIINYLWSTDLGTTEFLRQRSESNFQGTKCSFVLSLATIWPLSHFWPSQHWPSPYLRAKKDHGYRVLGVNKIFFMQISEDVLSRFGSDEVWMLDIEYFILFFFYFFSTAQNWGKKVLLVKASFVPIRNLS